MAETKIGKITHYYGKIGVGVIKLSKDLAVGDMIKVKGNNRDFTQSVSSMQLEHESLPSAKKGQNIGLKLDQPAKAGDEVFKV